MLFRGEPSDSSNATVPTPSSCRTRSFLFAYPSSSWMDTRVLNARLRVRFAEVCGVDPLVMPFEGSPVVMTCTIYGGRLRDARRRLWTFSIAVCCCLGRDGLENLMVENGRRMAWIQPGLVIQELSSFTTGWWSGLVIQEPSSFAAQKRISLPQSPPNRSQLQPHS
jgi:hypothetical protein